MNGFMVRDYEAADETACARIIHEVWGFDRQVAPHAFASALARSFTMCALTTSNVARVLDERGHPVGVLFGRTGGAPTFRTRYRGVLGLPRLAGELLGASAASARSAAGFLWDLARHERASGAALPGRPNEICLLALSPALQGRGGGRRLVEDFLARCRAGGGGRVVLETDSHCNWRFYEHLGFRRTGSFVSPLLARFFGGSGETFLYGIDVDGALPAPRTGAAATAG